MRDGPVVVAEVPPRDNPSFLRIEDQDFSVRVAPPDFHAENTAIRRKLHRCREGDWVLVPLDELVKASLELPEEGARGCVV